MALYTVAGLAGQIELPVPLVIDLLPAVNTAQRPGIALRKPHVWVQHETGNRNVGANALMHSRWLRSQPGVQTSFHFCVDDKEIRQFVPVDEVTWQAADGSGPGNMSGISCELCVNQDGNEALARRNAEALAGGVLKALGLGVGSVKRHWDFNSADPNRHHCPDRMMTQGYWGTFVKNVGAVIGGNPPVAYAQPVTVPAGDRSVNGRLFVALAREARLVVAATPRQFADPKARPTGPALAVGAAVTVTHVCAGADGQPWFVLRDGSRLPVAACVA